MNTEKINNLFLVLLSIVIAACNNGGTDSSNNVTPSGTVASLMFSQPYELASFENTAGNGYVVISNTDKNKNVTNITYNLSSVIGGASKISIDNTSAANCAVIKPLGNCTLKLNLESGAFGGSFVLGASNSSNSILNNLKQDFAATTEIRAKVPIGINPVATTSTSGINGIQLFYYSTLSNGMPEVVIVGSVISNNTGKFNTVTLLDQNNQVIANQTVISNNLGAGFANLTQGDSFSIMLAAPSEATSLSFKLQIAETESNGSVNNPLISSTVNTINTVSNQGLLYNYPSTIGLSPANANQTVVVAKL